MKKIFLILICGAAVLLSGCGSVSGTGREGDKAERTEAVVKTDDDSFEIPVSVPNVCVDLAGYEPDGEKIVIFRGKALPDTFTLRDAETDQVVYTGTVKNKGNDENSEEYNGYGDFSEYGEPGRYYIQIEVYGESYPFPIRDDLYESLFRYAWRQLYALGESGNGDGGWQSDNTGEDKIVEACQALYQLLLSYEMFPEVYTDDTGGTESGNGIPDILDLCGYEAKWLAEQAVDGDNNGTACGYLAAVLAKYAYLTRGTETDLAGQCLTAAETAWKSAGKDLFVTDDLIAMAAAELYRLTGSRQYLGLTEEYLEAAAEKTGRLSEEEFLAAITYMNTRNTVDIELCDSMMNKIMEETEAAAEHSRQSGFFIYDENGDGSADELLRQTSRLCVINHIITNHEYGTVIENHLHYLTGRNPEGICYVPCQEQGGEGTEDVRRLSALLFMLSERLVNKS